MTPFPWDLDNDQPLLVCRAGTGVALLNLNRYPDDDLLMPINDAGREAMASGELALVDVNIAVPLDADELVAATLAIGAEWLCDGALGCAGIEELASVHRPGERPAWSRIGDGVVACDVVAE